MAEVVSTAGRPVADVVAELNADPAVEYAEPNYVVALAEDPSVTAVGVNDPKTGPQYSLDRMRVRDAWSLSTGALPGSWPCSTPASTSGTPTSPGASYPATTS